ncbi:hypothetical protein BXZ70DRAFT_1064214 [Cristinia sonorae]|uniref:Potassium channel domain-containing protein n=1 Tax=Cristinia sonorae TaxID=1940300 RepID=A0A8K0UQB3_9AGAR|nr:hypothetical protein BXZ70DRAFT_1064214 [Cristinia sonorae]
MGFATLVLAVFAGFPSRSRNNRGDPEKASRESENEGQVLEEDASSDEEDIDEGEVQEVEGIAEDRSVDPRLTSSSFFTKSRSFRSLSVPFSRTVTADSSTVSVPSIFTRVKRFVFPSEDDLERFVPNYRWAPILSGVVIPFSILLEIPGLTEVWYIRTEGTQTVETQPNPPLLDIGMAFSIAFALLANIALIVRFLEKRVRSATLLSIAFLTVHDIINIVTVIIFGIEHRFDDGFTYGQAFWMTVCSTLVSTITNITLIMDFIFTPNFATSGSGLTRKQRSLVIIVIVLLIYIAFGALVNSLLMELSFIDGLYFTTVSIETIGFGDIVPETTSSRVFICFYMAFGVINIGLAVSMCRETVLEGLEIGYRLRLRKLRMRRREARRFRKWELRWKRAVEWRLKQNGLPVWVHDRHFEHEGVRFTGLSGVQDGAGEQHWMRKWFESIGVMKPLPTEGRRHIRGHPKGKHLNIDALSAQQLEAAALEAGVPLEMFLDPSSHPTISRHGSNTSEGSHGELNIGRPHLGIGQGLRRTASSNGWPAHPQTPTHAQIGRIAAMITKFAVATSGTHIRMMGHATEGTGDPTQDRQAHIEAVEDAKQTEAEVNPRKENSVWFEDGTGPARSGNRVGQVEEGQVEEGNGDTGESSGDKAGNGDAQSRTQPVDAGQQAPAQRWSREMARSAYRRSNFSYEQYKQEHEDEERKATWAKLTVAVSLFFMFWFIGSAIFHATEGWPYGTTMYFCFMAFTTTGYGDFAPVTPAGRSIFVVWALLGVATMTILISVLLEASSSRYKNALHSQVFDNAVKEFRKRENEETNRIAQERVFPRLRHWKETYSEGRAEQEEADEDEVTPGMVDAVREMAQRDLESLPGEIMRQTRRIHEHIQLYVNHGGGLGDGEEDAKTEDSEKKAKVQQELKALLDEVSKIEGISGKAKREILQDEDARNTLFMLIIERSLRRMINSAERSMAALAERDSLVALQRKMEHDAQDNPAIINATVTFDDTVESQGSTSTASSQVVDDYHDYPRTPVT